ncbi:MAG: hypothetical protein ACRCV5_06235 [Afipia sp.]
MRGKAQVELTIRYGEFGEQVKTVAIPISEGLTQELIGKVELSDEPFSLLLASPGVYGGKGDAVTIRRKAFAMRREVAEDIARAMVPELMKAFGVNDELDGYRVDGMSEEEREWHRKRGRL